MAVADLEAQLNQEVVSDRRAAENMSGIERGLGTLREVETQRVTVGNAVRFVDIPIYTEQQHKQMGRPVDKAYERSAQAVRSKLQVIGVSKATVVNFMPYPLRSASLLEPLRKAVVPGVKDNEEFTTFVFDTPHLEPARMGADAPLTCYDFHPIQFAEDFDKSYKIDGGGGVMAFIGIPSDIGKPGWIHQERFSQAKSASVLFMQKQLGAARNSWGKKLFWQVDDYSKLCIRRLYTLGFLKALPAELDQERDVSVAIPQCMKCGRPSEPHAVQCTNTQCDWIIDPKRAYMISAIDEQHPALERLTRAEVRAMGISDYVAETVDEKPERLRLGLPKQMSVVAQKLADSQDDYAREESEQTATIMGAQLGKALAAAQKKGQAKGKEAPEAPAKES